MTAELGMNFAVNPRSSPTGSFTMRPGSVVRTSTPKLNDNETAVLRDSQTRNQFDCSFDGDAFETGQMSGLAQLLSMLREKGIHESSSFSKRLMRRKKCAPQSFPLPASKRSDLNGIAISTLKPVS